MVRKLNPKGTEPVNPQFHDEFVALIALFYSGELTDEEWGLLQIHLAFCDECRERFEQYKHVTSKVIPEMAASAASEVDDLPWESESAIADAEQRLMAQLDDRPQPKAQPTTSRLSRWMAGGALAACALLAAALASVHLIRDSSQSPPPLNANIVSTPTTTAVPDDEAKLELERARQEVASLEQQLVAANERANQPKVLDLSLQHQLDTDRLQQQQLATERDDLSQQLVAAQADVQSLRDKVAATQTSADQEAARATSLEAKVRDLNSALGETNTALSDKERILALDKDFLAHDRDIRELIGARDLYIADIFDTNEIGKTAKPFGRIFYTKDRSLVFYGFDLDKQAGLKQSVAFQAWGSGSDKQTTSLGLFFQDANNKRWVLRCNDATTLARMNMVFVTVEPPGGSAKPTGKQLLRAFLQIQSNHP
jgi:anti-sigma-K factor RskA